jgi:hypothetical protein
MEDIVKNGKSEKKTHNDGNDSNNEKSRNDRSAFNSAWQLWHTSFLNGLKCTKLAGSMTF